MSVQFTCDCCGDRAAAPDLEEEIIQPPEGWRSIRTVIDERAGSGERTTEGEKAHTCAECNAHMDVDEHLEAEHAQRLRHMDHVGVDHPHGVSAAGAADGLTALAKAAENFKVGGTD